MCVFCVSISRPNTWYLLQIPIITRQSLYTPLKKWPAFYAKVLVWVRTYERCPIRPLWGGFWAWSALNKTSGGVDYNGWGCAGVHDCAKPNPKPKSQYVSQVRKGLGTRATWSIWEYDLTTAIAIRLGC